MSTPGFELTEELDRVVCAVAVRMWRPGGPIDLEDLKQIARLAALEALPKHNGTRTLPGFVANAARWRISDRYRHEKIEDSHRHWNRGEHSPVHEDDPHGHGGGWEDRLADPHDFTEDAATRLDAMQLAALLGYLRPRHRRVLVALYLVGQSRPYAEVAAEMGMQIDALKTLRRRALAELRRVQEERQVAA